MKRLAGSPEMRRWLCGLALACAGLVWLPPAVCAQSGTLDQRFEWAVGAGVSGPVRLDTADAEQLRPSGLPLNLFRTNAELGWSASFSTRLAIRLAPTLQFEAAGGISPIKLRVDILGDVEGTDEIALTESVRQWLFEGGLVVHLVREGRTARLVPFITGGGGGFWEVHEGNVLAETGMHMFGGGGVKRILRARPSGRFRAVGVRAEGRVVARSGGIGLDDNVHVFPLFTGALFVRF